MIPKRRLTVKGTYDKDELWLFIRLHEAQGTTKERMARELGVPMDRII